MPILETSGAVEWVGFGNSAVQLLKGAVSLIPKGKNRDAAKKALEAAQDALSRSDAELAKALGYKLCRFHYPPEIMLFVGDGAYSQCSACHRTLPNGMVISQEAVDNA